MRFGSERRSYLRLILTKKIGHEWAKKQYRQPLGWRYCIGGTMSEYYGVGLVA
jgi:hypothetical protein